LISGAESCSESPPQQKPAAASSRTVLVVLHEPILGGATLSLLRVIPALEARGWRFAFWAPEGGELTAWLVERGHQVEGAPRHIFSSLRALKLDPGPRRRLRSIAPYMASLRRYAAAVNPDLIHLNSITTLAEGLALRAIRAPILLHVHEMLPRTRKGELAARLASRLASEVVAVSRSSAARLERPGWAPRIVHESAPVPAFPRAASSGGPLRVGTVGVISRRKGTDIYVEAARLLKATAPEIEIELIGAPSDPFDAGWAEAVLAQAANLGIRHRLRADVAEAMSRWDVFALPSRHDPFPISMLEAMGLGLACIGSAVDGLLEQLEGGAGVLVPADDPSALAEAILGLRNDRSRRVALGEAARARVVEQYGPERQAAGLAAAYDSAVGLREAVA